MENVFDLLGNSKRFHNGRESGDELVPDPELDCRSGGAVNADNDQSYGAGVPSFAAHS